MAKQVKMGATELAEKWARRTKAATSDMSAGVERVTEAPGKAAVAKKDKLRQRWLESIDNGKWEANTGSYPLDAWKADMKGKGVQRVSQGVDGANDKMEHFASQLIDHQNAGLAKVDKLPDVTLSDSAARMVAWMEHMADMEYRKG